MSETPAGLIDIGANLGHESFAGDLPRVLEDARQAGVAGILVTGTSVAASERALALARAHPGFLYSTAGVHPHDAKDFTETDLERLRALADCGEVRAMGEMGLDFNRDFSPRDAQEAVFERQLALAAELGMPVFLHQRDAHERFMAILRGHRDALPRAVVHCFTGTAAELEDYLALDLYIGITGWICDERRGHHLHPLLPRIPADRLMLETDAPYLLPRSIRPKPSSRRNEPCYLPHVLATVAACLERPAQDVARQTTENARRFFDL